MAICWIVVTDSAQGRIFSADTRSHEVEEIEDLIHSESRIREKDLTSDRSGHSSALAGGGRHDMSKENSAHKHEMESFARQMAERLCSAHDAGKFRQLRLSAPPAFLGLLRNQLDKRLLDIMERSVDKNLVHESVDVIKAHLLGPEKH